MNNLREYDFAVISYTKANVGQVWIHGFMNDLFLIAIENG